MQQNYWQPSRTCGPKTNTDKGVGKLELSHIANGVNRVATVDNFYNCSEVRNSHPQTQN